MARYPVTRRPKPPSKPGGPCYASCPDPRTGARDHRCNPKPCPLDISVPAMSAVSNWRASAMGGTEDRIRQLRAGRQPK